MPWSGGIFTRTDGTRTGSNIAVQQRDGDVKVSAELYDNEQQDMAAAINNCWTRDGQNKPTANISMGNFQLLEVGTAITPDAAPRRDQVLLRDGSNPSTGAQNSGGNKILNTAAGTSTNDVAIYGQVMLRDGSLAATADISIGNFKLIDVATGTADTNGVNVGQVKAQDWAPVYGTTASPGTSVTMTNTKSYYKVSADGGYVWFAVQFVLNSNEVVPLVDLTLPASHEPSDFLNWELTARITDGTNHWYERAFVEGANNFVVITDTWNSGVLNTGGVNRSIFIQGSYST